MLGKLAGGVAVGVAGLARAAVSGRENGYRAGQCRHSSQSTSGVPGRLRSMPGRHGYGSVLVSCSSETSAVASRVQEPAPHLY